MVACSFKVAESRGVDPVLKVGGRGDQFIYTHICMHNRNANLGERQLDNIYIYIYIYIYIIYIYIYIYIYTHICMHNIYIYIYIYIYI